MSLHNVHKSLRFIFVIAQIFGFFPVQGVFEQEIEHLRFSWCSVRVVSSIFTIFVGIMASLGHLRHIIAIDGYEQPQMNAIVFYLCGTMSCIFFIKLSKEWNEIMLKWQSVDESMASYGWPKNLDRAMKRISVVFLVLEAAEHFSIQANKLIVSIQCRNSSFSKGLAHFSVNMSFPMIFDLINYDPVTGIVLQCVNTRMAFSWTFIDLFIILISCALTSRFAQVNDQIRYLSDSKEDKVEKWESVNQDYNRLCTFCSYLNDKISYLILISFFNNFYFIIFQVYASLTMVLAPPLEIVYYCISSGLLILRIVSVCLYASRVYEQSKLPLDIVASTPINIYNKEIVRLVESCKYQTVGMTGKRLFLITKHLILQITASVFAYELVVIQFNKNLPKKEKPSGNSRC